MLQFGYLFSILLQFGQSLSLCFLFGRQLQLGLVESIGLLLELLRDLLLFFRQVDNLILGGKLFRSFLTKPLFGLNMRLSLSERLGLCLLSGGDLNLNLSLGFGNLLVLLLQSYHVLLFSLGLKLNMCTSFGHLLVQLFLFVSSQMLMLLLGSHCRLTCFHLSGTCLRIRLLKEFINCITVAIGHVRSIRGIVEDGTVTQ